MLLQFLFKIKFKISRFNFIKNGNILAVSVVQNFEQIAKNLKNKNEILKKKSWKFGENIEKIEMKKNNFGKEKF